MMAGRKWPSIDVVSLYARGDSAGWNALLGSHLKNLDINGLAKLRYGIQAGLVDAGKSGFASPKLDSFFLRLQKSIEDTAKKIIRLKQPNPADNPHLSPEQRTQEVVRAKRVRDALLEAFIMESSF